jgi:general secretion pathway protein I
MNFDRSCEMTIKLQVARLAPAAQSEQSDCHLANALRLIVANVSLTTATRRRGRRRSGLSLLEVVLALTILAVAAALLAQVTTQATNNGLMAQRLAVAQMLCESKMSEVLSGSIQLTPSSWTQITDSGRRGIWYYQIQTVTAQRPNMIGVRLSVTDQPDSANPELFFIVRWMIDPSTGLDTPPSTDTSTSTSGSSSSSTSSGSSSGSAGGIQ